MTQVEKVAGRLGYAVGYVQGFTLVKTRALRKEIPTLKAVVSAFNDARKQDIVMEAQ